MAAPDNDTMESLLLSKNKSSTYVAHGVSDQKQSTKGLLDEAKEGELTQFSSVQSVHSSPKQADLLQKTSQSSPVVNLRKDYKNINQPKCDDENLDEAMPLLKEDIKATQCLREALEECCSTQESHSTCTCTCNCNFQCIYGCKESPFKLESIKKAKQIGKKVIMKTVLRNLFHKAIIREVFIYLSVVSLLISTSFSLVSILQNREARNESFTDDIKNETKEENAIILITFNDISFGVSVLGLLFTIFDLSLYLRHHGCRVLKRTCKCQKLVQPGDEEKAECFNDSCACEGTCGKGCTTVMDIVRIVVLETIFYPNLLLNIFKAIILLSESDTDFKKIIHWVTAISNFGSVIIFVYIKKAYIFFGVIRSIRKVKTGINKKCQGISFIVTFFIYMCALMFLQLLMIVAITGRFLHEYTQKNPIKNSWQLWYMMIFAYLMPLIGMPMFFLVHQFWTSKLPVDVVRDLMSKLQTKGKGSNRSKNKTDEMVEQVINHLGNDRFRNDYTMFETITLFEKLVYPCTSPLRVAASSLYIGAFVGFFVSSMYNGPSDWLGFHIAVAIIAYFINIYAASIAAYLHLLIILLSFLVYFLMFLIIL